MSWSNELMEIIAVSKSAYIIFPRDVRAIDGGFRALYVSALAQYVFRRSRESAALFIIGI
jgi:hypothetical protein